MGGYTVKTEGESVYSLPSLNFFHTKGGLMIPKKFKLGAYEYEVEYPYIFKERNDIAGYHHGGRTKILLTDRTQSGDRYSDIVVFQTFLHEVLHAIDMVFCMEQIGKECSKEDLINGISEGLTQFLLDNGFWEGGGDGTKDIR